MKYWNVLSVSEQVGVGHVTLLDQWLWVRVIGQALIGWERGYVGGSGVKEEVECEETSATCDECRSDKQGDMFFGRWLQPTETCSWIKLQIRRGSPVWSLRRGCYTLNPTHCFINEAPGPYMCSCFCMCIYLWETATATFIKRQWSFSASRRIQVLGPE